MSTVKGVPAIVPFMSANGKSDGIDDADPTIDVGFGFRPAPDTEYPPAVPLMDLMVGVMPVAPVPGDCGGSPAQRDPREASEKSTGRRRDQHPRPSGPSVEVTDGPCGC